MQQNNNGAIYFLGGIGFICLAVWWIEDRFGTTQTGYVLVGLGIAIAIVVGFVLNMVSSKNILSNLAEFNRQDAQIDRYRMLAHKEFARGEAAQQRADAQLRVIDARRIAQQANQQAKALVDVERQKWALQLQQRELASTPAQAEDDWWTTDPLQEDGWE